MLIFSRESLAFLANPKTGTTAFYMAMRPKADIIFAKQRKHLNARRYARRVAPWLAESLGVRPEPMSIMRDPADHMRSWYKYRSGPRLAGTELSTDGLSFDDFVLAAISDDPPRCAQIGSQYEFLTDGGEVLITHLFAYERQPTFRGFLAERFGGEVTLKPKNVSPPVHAPLSDAVRAQLRAARPAEFALYDRLLAADGYLRT